MGDASSAGCVPTGLLDNLVGYWRLDDGVGSTVAFDSSGRKNEGILHDLDPRTAWVAGRSQGALEIAHSGWVQVAPSSSIDSITDRVTLTAWVDLEGTINAMDSWGTALSRQTGTSTDQHYHLSLFMDDRPSLFLITVSGYAVIKATDPASKGLWTHLAGVYDGAVARLYVNGKEVASQALTGNFAPDTTPVILGGNGNDASGVPTELFPGRIDEVMLYARALSATEISQLAAGALLPMSPGDAGAD
jgi:beta-galactosidase